MLIMVPTKPRCGKSSVNGSTPRIEPQITSRAEAVDERAAEERPRGDRGEEHEQQHLRALDRHAERLDQVERVVAVQAREVDHLRKQHHDQHRERAEDDCAGWVGPAAATALPFFARWRPYHR